MPEEHDVKQDLRFVVTGDAPTVQSPLSPRIEHDREALRIRYQRSIDSCLKGGYSAEAELLSKALVDLHEDNDFSADHAEALLQKIEASTKAASVDLGAFELAHARRKRPKMVVSICIAAALIISSIVIAAVTSPQQQATSPAPSGTPLKTAAEPSDSPPMFALPIGTPVSIEYKGEWWPAVITAHDGHLSEIHYVGWDCSWDEWVTPDRMRSLPQPDIEEIKSQAHPGKDIHEAYSGMKTSTSPPRRQSENEKKP